MPRKLLLVDESVTIGRVVEMTFTGGDVQVIAVGNRREAMDRILQEQPDIVLADLGLDTPDGYELAAYVKGHPRLCHVPVLLLTGAFQPIDEPRAARCGCDGVLAKPFDVESMHETVTGLLHAPRVEDEPDAGLAAVEQTAAMATGARLVEAGPIAPAVEGAPAVADASAGAAAAIDMLESFFAAFMAAVPEGPPPQRAAPVPAEVPEGAQRSGDPCADVEPEETAALTGAAAHLEVDAASQDPAPASDIRPPSGPARDEETVDGWAELLRPAANIDPAPDSADGSPAEEADPAPWPTGCLDRLSAEMHSGSMTDGGAPGCVADPALVASALSLDDYFDLVDEILARSREAVASGGAPCEIPRFHLYPQR